MSLPQTVYFSISNFWYKLTQPNVYRGQFLKGYISRIFTSGQFLKGNICGMFTRRQSLKGNICGIFTGGPSLNGNTYLWNVLVDTGHCGQSLHIWKYLEGAVFWKLMKVVWLVRSKLKTVSFCKIEKNIIGKYFIEAHNKFTGETKCWIFLTFNYNWTLGFVEWLKS